MKTNPILVILLVFTLNNSTHASIWDCFKLFQKNKQEKLIHGLSQKRIDFIESINIGDKVTISLKRLNLRGEIKNISFNDLYLLTESGERQIISIKKILLLNKTKVSSSQKSNRFLRLIANKKSELTYFKSNEELLKNFSLFTQETKEQQIIINKEIAHEIEKGIKAKFQTKEIGFHFNLNGGQAIDYINAGGIRASRGGDVAVQFGDRNAQIAPQSYFFRTNDQMSLYDIVSMGNMKRIRANSGRMGNVVNIFKADAEIFQKGLESAQIQDTGISYVFTEKWLRQNSKNEIGIPYSTYLTEPIEIYEYKKFGFKKLTRNQIDYLALRQIEFNTLK